MSNDSSIPNQPQINKGSAQGAAHEHFRDNPTASTTPTEIATHNAGQSVGPAPNKWQNIPAEMQALNQWVVAGSDKVPYIVISGRTHKASPADGPWMTFADACGYAGSNNLSIGIVLTASDPFACVDMDVKDSLSVDKKTGLTLVEPQWTTQDHVNEFTNFINIAKTYTEISVGGKGAHLWVKGGVGRGRRNEQWEVYDRERYIICTGNSVTNVRWDKQADGTMPITACEQGLHAIEARQNLLDGLIKEIGKSGDDELDELEELPQEVDDETILQIATNSANGEKFNRLYTGDLTGYDSASEADHALIEMLCFFSRSNEQVRRMFLASKLGKREKVVKRGAEYINRSITVVRPSIKRAKARWERENQIAEAQFEEWKEIGMVDVVNGLLDDHIAANEAHQPSTFSPLVGTENKLVAKSLAEFMQEEQFIEFLIDDIFRRGGLYAITGLTGSGKTGIGVTTAMLVACGLPFGQNETTTTNVLYIAGENPSDIRMRFRALTTYYPDTYKHTANSIQVIDQSFLLEHKLHELEEIIDYNNIGLVIVDTDQAVYGGDDTKNDLRLLHAKRARQLTKRPSKPTVIMQCHATKYGESLQPRGGSSFINELDGNYCCTFDKNIDTATLKPDENKWRGDRSLAEMKFHATYPKYNTDNKGRPISTPIFTAMAVNLHNVLNQIEEPTQNVEFDEFMFNHIGEMVQRGDYPSQTNLSRGKGLAEVKVLWTGTGATQRTVIDSIARLTKAGRVTKAPKLSHTNTEYLITVEHNGKGSQR